MSVQQNSVLRNKAFFTTISLIARLLTQVTKNTEWLPGWTVLVTKKNIYKKYPKKCRTIRLAGKRLFTLGVLPLLGDAAPVTHRDGTGGNLAVRTRRRSKSFLVTARGTHKGKLKARDIVRVDRIDWEKKEVCVTAALTTILPSTDSLLVASAFESDARLMAWAHFHRPIASHIAVRFHYPALEEDEWKTLKKILLGRIRFVNMIDHDLAKKGGPNGTEDSAIVVGKSLKGVVKKAIALIR